MKWVVRMHDFGGFASASQIKSMFGELGGVM